MLKAIDLFCGGGGSGYGAQKAGVQIVAAVDMSPIATATYSTNFPEAQIFNNRLEDISPKTLKAAVGNIDLLMASPECTNHTCAKGSAPRCENSRATAFQVIRYAKTFKPRWIIVENVVHMRSWQRYEEFLNTLSAEGYNTRAYTLDATDFGVPQKRRRLFIACDREALPPLNISPEFQDKLPTVESILDPPGTWKMTPLFSNRRAKPTLERAKRAIDALGPNKPFLIVYYGSDGSGGWQRLDRSLRTITTVDRFALVVPHPAGYQMRMLQVPELKRAMGFEDDYEIVASRRESIKLLGNGVCPPVMSAIIRQLTGKNQTKAITQQASVMHRNPAYIRRAAGVFRIPLPIA